MFHHFRNRFSYFITHPKRNKNKFLYFLISIILLIIFVPFAEKGLFSAACLNLLTTIIILSGVYAVSETKSHIVISLMLGVPWVLINWLDLFIYQQMSGPGAISWGVLFFIYTTFIVFKHIIKGSRITRETLYGAITVYLLIGIAYTSIYALIESINPGSFNITYYKGNIFPFKLHEFIYFSYVTLTTLGFGDTVPVTAHARILAISEAIVGQLYLTILVARLVGLHISSISSK